MLYRLLNSAQSVNISPQIPPNMHMPKLYNVYFLATIATVGGML